ncbi:hypothetical protein JD78_04344 [Modestobacter roseus]|uniref:Uncharacterized protein n=1 Tax=Modestobacter roseus TaxID=1181884 RepID=A0A562HX70_9ACTN|nr:hypothetical protein [Modestobacter roseus]TWH63216.1 hypothetical protein JD78_04344 [Modestobacter roseus]
MRALQSGQLRGIRDNAGNWQIEPEAVDDWMSLRRSPDRQSPAMTDGQLSVSPADTPETLSRLAVSEARVEMLTAQLSELRQDRDAWRAQAERLASERQSDLIIRPSLIERLLDRLGRRS